MRSTLMATAALVAAGLVAATSSASNGTADGVLRANGLDGIRFTLAPAVLRKPAISIGNASRVEGNSGAGPLAFAVKLSASSKKVVSVRYRTVDGTATAPDDYTAAAGTLTFRPGQKRKTIAVTVNGDTEIESNETFTVALSGPRNARMAKASGIGTITNDDTAPPPPTAAPVTAGSYQGQTQNGNYVFFNVTSGREVTAFRVNDLPDACAEGGELTGGVNFGDSTFTIGSDGSFAAQGNGDATPQGDGITHWEVKLNGNFGSATASTGTYSESIVYSFQGSLYHCSSGVISWSAALQG